MNFFSEEARRDPFPLYDHVRTSAPTLHDPQSGLWMIFDYAGVKRALTEHDTFSSRVGPPWLVFTDPPRQTKLRALIMRAFTPRAVANLEPRIRELSRQLLDPVVDRGEMDLAADFSVPLPMLVIAEMLGIPAADRPRFERWSETILNMSHTIPGTARANQSADEFAAVTVEMNDYLGGLLDERRAAPTGDLLTGLVEAEVDGERLSGEEILGFFQLLLVGGQETTTNLINSAILCFLENPDQLARLRAAPELLPSAIEEALRYRSPVQWMFRLVKRDTEVNGKTIPAGKLALAMIGSANRDEAQFADAARFDITRDPNPHLAFGHGIHFCLGAALSRMEARIALSDLLSRMRRFELASGEPWEPGKALHVHGPTRLRVRFEPT